MHDPVFGDIDQNVHFFEIESRKVNTRGRPDLFDLLKT